MDDFGHWLAGFIDGEGCFTIIRNANGGWENKFFINVRDDESEIIQDIQSRLQIGRTYHLAARTYSKSKPQISWRVYRHDDCLALIDFLDQYPLRAKKARDFAIWRKAVEAKDRKDFTLLGKLSQEIKDVRAYKPPTSGR